MKLTLAAVAAVLTLGQAHAVLAQDDDWEFAEDPAQQLSVAAVRYEGAAAIVVQCRSGVLTAVMAGVPEATGEVVLTAARADGRADVQTWRPAGAPGALRSTVPSRDVRFLRGGGAYTVRTAGGTAASFGTTFDLPQQSANLDRVLAACGWALTEERDLLPRADRAASLSDPEAAERRPRRSVSRSITERRHHAPSAQASPPEAQVIPAEEQISCIVRDRHLRDCRPMHPAAAGTATTGRVMRWLEGHQLYGVEGQAVEGEVFYNDVAQPLIVVERIERLG